MAWGSWRCLQPYRMRLDVSENLCRYSGFLKYFSVAAKKALTNLSAVYIRWVNRDVARLGEVCWFCPLLPAGGFKPEAPCERPRGGQEGGPEQKGGRS